MIPISWGDIITLIEKGIQLRKLPAQIRARRAERLVNESLDARTLRSLYKFLRRVYYDLPILTGPDGPFPIGVLPVSPQTASNVDRLSVNLGQALSSFLVMHPEVVQVLLRRGVNFWNGTTFSLNGVNFDKDGAIDGLSGI